MRLNNLLVVLSATAPLAAAFPLNSLGLASWDVEGFAKDNPIGPTTGGKGGATVTVDNAADLKAAVAGDQPKIIRVKGEINLPARPKIGSNKSIIGIGKTAHITGSGLDVFNSTNVVIQNLKISFIKDNDCITIRNSTRVWVDHNEFASDISQGPDEYVSFATARIYPSPL
jgi:pectate lyase